MAEMKTLNGHEIVDAAARKRLDEMEKNGVGGGGTVVAYDTDSDTGTANYTASEIKALVDSGKTVVVENGNSGNTLIKYVDYIDGVAIFEHTFVEGVTISTIRYEIDENKNVSYEIATVSPVTSVNGKTSETGDVELSASDVGAYSKEETNEMISSIPRFNIEVVDVHPTITEASTTTVYLVPSGADDQNLYTEWICVEKDGARTWEKLGTQNLDLTGYVTTEELAASVERALSEAKESGEFKGDKGDQGEQGIQGAAGVSPTVTVTEITGGHRVSVTDASGTKSFDVLNGVDGKDGTDGAGSESYSIPSYWQTMIDTKTETVKALQEAGGKNSVSFVWTSDTHIDAVDRDHGSTKGYSGGNSADIGKLMAQMLDNCEIPFAMISGDIATRSSLSTEELYLGRLASVSKWLYPLWGTDRLLMALGNHDGVWGEGSETNASGYYSKRFTPEKMWHTFFRGQALDFRRVLSEDGKYFYVDNIPQKTRFVMLNSHFAADYTDGRTYFDTSCYGQAQLDWLANVALNMPEGYGAVIVTHVPPKPVNGSTIPYTVDYAQLNGIINAYCNKTTFSGSYTEGVDGWSNSTVNVDFTDAKGEIIAVFAGHIHWDSVDTTTLACPLITIIASGAPANTVNAQEGETVPVRYPWGESGVGDQETSFDVVTINRATKIIYCTRVGAGSDRIINYGDAEIVTYTVTNDLTGCTSSNSASIVQEGAFYTAIISANSGYTLDSVTVIMGGVDITSTAVSGGVVTISSVTGNIVITATASEIPVETTPTNFANPSDSNWKDGYRISSSASTSGYVAALDGSAATNIIGAVEAGDIVEVYGMNLTSNNSKVCMCVSESDVKPTGDGVYSGINAASDFNLASNVTADSESAVFTCEKAGYWRFSGALNTTSADVVIRIMRDGVYL